LFAAEGFYRDVFPPVKEGHCSFDKAKKPPQEIPAAAFSFDRQGVKRAGSG